MPFDAPKPRSERLPTILRYAAIPEEFAKRLPKCGQMIAVALARSGDYV